MFRHYRVDEQQPAHPAAAARRIGASDHGSQASAVSSLQLSAPSWRALAQALVAVLYLGGALVACGDDSDNGSMTAQPDAGAKGTAGSGGSGAAGNMSFAPPEPVACGSATCNAPTNPLSGIASMFGGALGGALPMAGACCLDESAGTCGLTPDMGTTCEPKAVADARCPGADLGMLGSFLGSSNMNGCCIDNMCGQDGAMFGRGCVPNAEAMSMVSSLPLIGSMIKFPPSLACDRPMDMDMDMDMDTDAGVSDDQDAGM